MKIKDQWRREITTIPILKIARKRQPIVGANNSSYP